MKPENRQILDKINVLNGTGDVQEKTNKTDFNSHLADYVYQTAGGTTTAITLTISGALVKGYPITFIAKYTDNTTPKTINNKKFYKPNTTISPNTVAGKAYTVWYEPTGDNNNGCFFIKASAEGTAVAGNVLAGTTFSNDSDTGVTGTMPNNGTFNLGMGVSVPAGYYSGGTTEGITLVAGFDTLVNSGNSGIVNSISYTKVREILIKAAGIIRVSFTLFSSSGYASYGRIYVNGIAVGAERISTSTSGTTFTEDITIAANSLVQIYIKGSYAVNNAYISLTNIKWDSASSGIAVVKL